MEQGYLKRYLESGFDPNDYAEELADWLESEESGDWRDEDGLPDYDKLYEWVDSATAGRIEEFRRHIEESRLPSSLDRPVYEHMEYSRLVRPTWLVHFTDDPDDIAENGFKYGWDGTEGLGLTTHFTDNVRKRGPGYNFAFVVGSRDARNAASGYFDADPKYGKHAVVFWVGGVEAYHYGDEESQVIFWGRRILSRTVRLCGQPRDSAGQDIHPVERQ